MEGDLTTGELPNGGGIAGSQLLEWTSPDILLNDAFDAARCDIDDESNAPLHLSCHIVVTQVFHTHIFAPNMYRIGLRLGDRLVLLGSSTGGALCAYLAAKASPEIKSKVACLVGISPAFRVGIPAYPAVSTLFAW